MQDFPLVVFQGAFEYNKIYNEMKKIKYLT